MCDVLRRAQNGINSASDVNLDEKRGLIINCIAQYSSKFN